MNRLNAISNITINKYLGKYPLYNGCFSCLQLPKIEVGCYVINISEDPQAGTHWVTVIVRTNSINYIDSFGQIPNSQILEWIKKTKKPIMYNVNDFQALKSDACGYFCMYIISNYCKGRSINSILHDFSNEVDYNQHLLMNYFNK